ncbi:MAG: prolipoprotein diacylglyceryl transferase [Candidatus Tectomicrobia bacterium]|uniref:Phosphatidylglycerol--prolipoprotein diacylglyceryl transferase n=1 Tax=Tectimicrobiota bacterium TaxID=2528274 RepID=A0A933GJK2_UNCTE|nr:prolipoprotein diacylglyceryl transferase [Candidatus Tectomicrobia bacterium]
MHPILFQWGPITIRYYGLMYVIAIIVGTYLVKGEIKRKNLPLSEDNLYNLVLLVFFAGLIGARLFYVIFSLDFYLANPKEIPAIWHGGLAIHGGLIGGFLAGYWYSKSKKMSFLVMADLFAPSIILGQAFGRFGNFMNGDAHGVPTDLPWGIVFPPNSIAGQQFGQIPLHPVMLYELVLNLIIFITLRKWRLRPAKDGYIICLYLIFYSFARFFVSFFRADNLMVAGLSVPHLTSLLIIVVVGYFLVSKRLWVAPVSKNKKEQVR